MGRHSSTGPTPALETLYELASEQAGYFSSAQARELGFGTARLQHHVKTGKLRRSTHGVLRLRDFPTTPFEEYVVPWLWSERRGVISHDTALMLHELSDALPSHIHMTLPASWEKRRLRVLDNLVLHFADVPETERVWKESVPVTSPLRTIEDCIRVGVAPELVGQAVRQAQQRGLIDRPTAKRLGAEK